MAENRLYRTDQYMKKNTAKVLEIAEKNGCDSIVCDCSVFFPEGGGQPSDRGNVSGKNGTWQVLYAEDDGLESAVWHVTSAPAGTFSIGDEVLLEIDWEWRFINMQRHLGEHMLSGAFNNLYGGVNRGFHMGDEYITIDIDLDGRMLTEAELDEAERTVNNAIRMDLPVTISYFENYEDSLVMPVRKQVPHDGRVSVVTVGELPDPYDCIACCGTHPASTGQVGLISVYKHEPNKGMNRIYFDCGVMAKEHQMTEHKLLTEIAVRNSCATTDLLHKLEAGEESARDLKLQLAKMAGYIKEKEMREISIQLEEQKSLVYEMGLISVDDLLKLGFAVIGETSGKLLILLHDEAQTALLFSSDSEVRCGVLVKENAQKFGGRGGGRDDNARAVFASVKEMREFAEAVAMVV